MNPQFWRGKRVFLTGHTGFKGGWLSLWLQSLGAEVKGFSLAAPTQPNLFEVAHVAADMDSVVGDIRDLTHLTAQMVAFKPEIIIHMAAQSLVRFSYKEPVETYATNVMGTVHILEAVRRVGSARCVVNITSDKCYENREWIWGYRENEPMGGHDPYSSSKGCAELVTSAYRQSYFYEKDAVALASTRAGNVIGGGDWAEDRLIPDILRAFEKSIPVIIRNPNAIRPWQHVLEPLSGYLMLVEALWNERQKFSEGWNFGPRDEGARSVLWIVEHMAKDWGDGANWKVDVSDNPHEAAFLKLDCSKSMLRLNWVGRWNLNTALERIVSWHRAWLHGDDMRSYCLSEIAAYTSAMTDLESN